MNTNVRTIALALYEGKSPNKKQTIQEFAASMQEVNGLTMKDGDLLRNGKPIAHVEERPDYRGKKTKPTVWDYYDWENYQEVERMLSKAQDERNVYKVHEAEKRAENICDGTKRKRVMREIERFVEESDALHWNTDAGTEPASGCDPYDDPFKNVQDPKPKTASEIMKEMGVTVVNMDETTEKPNMKEMLRKHAAEIAKAKEASDKLLAEVKMLRSERKEMMAEIEALRKAETEEPVSQDDGDEAGEIVSQFIAEHECAYLAGETSAAYYIGGIKEGTPEHKAIKELGAGFAKRHKKHPNTWYFKKTA